MGRRPPRLGGVRAGLIRIGQIPGVCREDGADPRRGNPPGPATTGGRSGALGGVSARPSFRSDETEGGTKRLPSDGGVVRSLSSVPSEFATRCRSVSLFSPIPLRTRRNAGRELLSSVSKSSSRFCISGSDSVSTCSCSYASRSLRLDAAVSEPLLDEPSDGTPCQRSTLAVAVVHVIPAVGGHRCCWRKGPLARLHGGS